MAMSADIKVCFIPTEAKQYKDRIKVTILQNHQEYYVCVMGRGILNLNFKDKLNLEMEYEEYVDPDLKEAQYIDFNIDLPKNPNTGDVPRLFDEDAVMQSIKSIILSKKLWYGNDLDIYSLLFEDIGSPFRGEQISDIIKEKIETVEPRLGMLQVDVDTDMNNDSQINIQIKFSLKNNKNIIYEYPLLVKVR